VLQVRLGAREVADRREQHELQFASLLREFRSVGLEPIVLSSSDPAEIGTAFLRWADERIYVRGRA
jgi:hypothetical protein